MWNLIQLYKWAIITCILFFIRQYPGLQIPLLFYFSIIMQTLILKFRPFENPADNKLALINEMLISTYLAVYVGLTDNVQVQSDRDMSGIFLLGIVFTFVAVNFGYLFAQIVLMVIRWFKIKSLRELARMKTQSKLSDNSQILQEATSIKSNVITIATKKRSKSKTKVQSQHKKRLSEFLRIQDQGVTETETNIERATSNEISFVKNVSPKKIKFQFKTPTKAEIRGQRRKKTIFNAPQTANCNLFQEQDLPFYCHEEQLRKFKPEVLNQNCLIGFDDELYQKGI
ncbi:hypothetical protein FGO68_gene9507 [Halteria grandinella]|uniref:Uncharacterized protein n=1 Tax=Halteria grandinella TaxID=5974 RepID=A0A8J8P5H4_HALGN|nr:hypothetical protein FGO68_gene9507 [Halteria grandinella]